MQNQEKMSLFTDRARVAAFVLIVLLGGTIYANSLHNTFHLDDDIFIIHNPAVRSLWNWPALWASFNTRFVTGLSFALNYRFGGLDVFGYHVVNLLLHFMNAFLVFVFVRKLLQTPFFESRSAADAGAPAVTAVLTALVFLAHPLQTQAVNYISQRAVLLAVFFYLLSIVFYLKWAGAAHRDYYIASLAAAVLAMFSKELAFTLPLMLFIIHVFFIRRSYESLLGGLKRLSPFFLTWFIIPFSLLAERSSSIVDLREQLATGRFHVNNGLTALNALRTYFWLCLAPVRQNLDYDFPRAQSVWEGQTLLSIILIVGLAAWACRQFNRRRVFSFCVIWFLVSLMMEFLSSALLGKDMIFEHWLYLALTGFALFVVSGFQALFKNRVFFYVVIGVWLAGLGILTYQRNAVWKNPVTLWTDVLRKSPRKVRPYDNLAAAYMGVGNYRAAKQMLYHAIRLDPRSYKTLNNLGLIFLEEGNVLEARDYFEKALGVNPEYAETWSNLGVLYLRTGQLQQAQEVFLKVQSLNPALLEARRNLALVYQQQGEHLRAIEIYQNILKYDPHEEESLYNLTELYLEAGLQPSALEAAQRVLAEGTDAGRLTALGSRFAAAGAAPAALSFFQKALEKDPDYPAAYVELGKFYGNRDDFTRAIATWQEGQHRAPDDPRFKDLITQAEALKP